MAKKLVKAPKKKTVVKKVKPAKSVVQRAKPVKLDKSLVDPLRQAARSSAARRTMR